ncbi:MAG TPA: N-(5'-phosphoribosyl)anthranilate isomerase, partial [Rhizomicrobium sp.]|nr:N-(5'-phosphoribosyl)anthranilate isomerase [Rhizomicrobium sp.]
MTVAVKICGLTTLDAVDAAASAGAIYGGLVFHPRSPRFVMPEQARALADRMRGRLKTVALITDMDDAGIAAVMKAAA